MNVPDFDYVRHYVHKHAAIVIEPGKEYLVESRLLTLARKENIPSIEVLMESLRKDPKSHLHRRVLDAMTTNETSFFRDAHPFEALKKFILPELLEKHKVDKLVNFWCGAASTGQESFSVLMTIANHFPELLNWRMSFTATDLSKDVLAQAKLGRFSQFEVNRGLPAAMLIKHFKRHGDYWEFDENLRKRVDFREMNLVEQWLPMPPMDIVFLRNVLIYFDIATKKAILGKIHDLLRPGGYLFLGGAESTINLDERFERVVMDKSTCYRRVQS